MTDREVFGNIEASSSTCGPRIEAEKARNDEQSGLRPFAENNRTGKISGGVESRATVRRRS